jgi:predicted Zn finger-like uncharacterized protein
MLIQCEKCRTLFNLDETLLKEAGSKVRCSRCQHLFMAYPPRPKEADAPKKSADPQPTQEARDDALILMGHEEEIPAPALGKDAAFDAELESVYRDALMEPVPDLDEEKEIPLEAIGSDDLSADRTAGEEPAGQGSELSAASKSKKTRRKGGLRTVLLIILLALLAGIAAALYLRPGLIEPYLSLVKMPEKEKPAEPGVRLLKFTSVAGSFVKAQGSAELFVIRGMVHNNYPEPRSHILIKGSILDHKGNVVESRTAYAGNTFTEEELKTLPMDEIMKAMQHRDGMARQNFNIPPGTAIPFLVVFDHLPESVSEFAVEAVSSSPGI